MVPPMYEKLMVACQPVAFGAMIHCPVRVALRYSCHSRKLYKHTHNDESSNCSRLC